MSDPRTPEEAMRQMRKRVADAIHAHRGYYLFVGIALTLLGIAAIAFPHVTTLAATVFIGWMFVIGGIVQGAQAFSMHKLGAVLLGSLLALLSIAVGLLIIMNPPEGALTITLVLIGFFLADGILRLFAAFRFRPLSGWVFVALSGVVSILMAALLFGLLPEAADWIIGLMVGINFLMWGLTVLMLTASAKKIADGDE